MATPGTTPITSPAEAALPTPAPVHTKVLKPEVEPAVARAAQPVSASDLAAVVQAETQAFPDAGAIDAMAAVARATVPSLAQTRASAPPVETPMANDRSLIASTEATRSAPIKEATKNEVAGKKSKAEPETLEQFIEYAYGRKGQALILKSKVEMQVAQNVRLDDAALSRLLQLAKGDTLLVVPRQILLLSQEVTGLPSLKAALTSFVSNVMLRHPVFGDAGVQGALRHLPEGLQPLDALARVAAFEPSPSSNAEQWKGSDLRDLRNNAVRLLVTWLGVNQGLNAEDLSSLLFQVVWQPAAKDLADDAARLRALTDISQAAGVGVACQRFRQQAIAAWSQQDHAQREAISLRDRLSVAERQLSQTAEELKAVRTELQALRESSKAEMNAMHAQHTVDRTHLRHELEQLRGRLVKRMTDSVELLEVGLSALRRDTPRVPVMVERAEHVVDTLIAEVQKLSEE
jgi:hypothetical protein